MQILYKTICRPVTLMLLAGSSLLFACSDGDVGPQGQKGETGDKGAVGDTGTTGEDGEGYLTKRGSYEGTVTGTRQDGTDFTETFKFEYSEETFEELYNYGEGYYEIGLARYSESSWNELNSYLGIYINIQNLGEAEQEVYATDFDFEFSKALGANKVFRLELEYGGEGESEDSPIVTITNFNYNDVTGALTYDFSFTYDGENTDYNSTGNPITVTGKFNSGAGTIYNENVVRKRG